MVNCKWLIVSWFVLILTACALTPETVVLPTLLPTKQPTPTLFVTPTPVHPVTLSSPADTGWQPLQTGLDRRTIQVMDENGRQTEQLTILRIDPNLFAFEIEYSPGQPKSLATWQEETGAFIVVNGGFFTPEYEATGLIVVDGQPSGSSYVGFGGMVTMDQGDVEVRSLVERPYQPTETFDDALQAFPMLVLNGESAYQTADFDRARRTAIGVDGNGRILIIIAGWGGFTLAEFSNHLANADFGLVTALNLDGGSSTGFILTEPPESVLSFTAVPSVLLIFPQ